MSLAVPMLMSLPEEQLRAIFRGLIPMGCCANKRLAEMLRVAGGPEAPFRFQIFEDITTADLTRILKRFPNAVIGMRAKRAILPNEARVVKVYGTMDMIALKGQPGGVDPAHLKRIVDMADSLEKQPILPTWLVLDHYFDVLGYLDRGLTYEQRGYVAGSLYKLLTRFVEYPRSLPMSYLAQLTRFLQLTRNLPKATRDPTLAVSVAY
jgi:hypothetical protein